MAASPADALFPEEPLATVRFYNSDIKYVSAVESALRAAVATNDSITFIIRGTSVSGSDKSRDFIRQNAEKTLLMLRDMKVSSDRMQTLYDVDSETSFPVLRIYVR